MKATLISLAALATLSLASGDDVFGYDAAKCDTPDVEKVPKENDCLQMVQKWAGGHKDTGALAGGKWHTVVCSDQCKVSVKPEKGGSKLKSDDLESGLQDIMNNCFLVGGKANRSQPFKGQISGGGWTASVKKGGDC